MATPHPNWKNISAVIGVIVVLLTAGVSFASKADKQEAQELREHFGLLREKVSVNERTQQHQLELLRDMREQMKRIEDKQDFLIQESYKRSYGAGQPPLATPAPNPLSNPIGR